MRHQCPTHEIKEQAALYALGVLTQLEARAFESHIREGCEICRSELFKFERAAGMFALNAPQIKPPAYLIDLLLARIEKETVERTWPSDDHVASRNFFSLLREKVRNLFSAIPWRVIGLRAIPWAAASALGIVSIILFVALSAAHSVSASHDEAMTQAKAEIEQMHGLVERAADRSKELAQIVAILGVPGVRQVQLVGEGAGASSKVALYLDDNRGLSIVSADHLPVAEGMVHHLWFVTPTGPKDAGTLQTDSTGHGFLATSAGANFGEITAACITLEPTGESDRPTTPVLALGKIIRNAHPRRQRNSETVETSQDAQPDSQSGSQPRAQQRPRQVAQPASQPDGNGTSNNH